MAFEQATIKVEKEKEFEELKGAIDRAFAPESVEKFLKRVRSKRCACGFAILMGCWPSGVLEQVDEALAKRGAQRLYQALPVSDQAQMREFYLSKLEEVSPELRTKFQKLYQYY